MEALLLGEQMAVGLIIQFSDVDAAKYDAVAKEAGSKARRPSGQRVSSAMQLVQQQTAGVSLTCGVHRHNSTGF